MDYKIALLCIVCFVIGLFSIQGFQYARSHFSMETPSTMSGLKTKQEETDNKLKEVIDVLTSKQNGTETPSDGDKSKTEDDKAPEPENTTVNSPDKLANEIVPPVTPSKVEPVKANPVPNVNLQQIQAVSKGKPEPEKTDDNPTNKENPMLKVIDKLVEERK